MAQYGRIDILVNNAGYHIGRPFLESNPDDFWQMVNIHGLSHCFTMWEILPIMMKLGGGCVINVSSKLGVRPSEHIPFYCFVKAGMDHLTRCLSNDYAQYGIRLNSLSPGLTHPSMIEIDPQFYKSAESVPMKRYGTAEDMAGDRRRCLCGRRPYPC
jgi:3alpha(or 20beta)-hydroxysteroid dehydrogenase